MYNMALTTVVNRFWFVDKISPFIFYNHNGQAFDDRLIICVKIVDCVRRPILIKYMQFFLKQAAMF